MWPSAVLQWQKFCYSAPASTILVYRSRRWRRKRIAPAQCSHKRCQWPSPASPSPEWNIYSDYQSCKCNRIREDPKGKSNSSQIGAAGPEIDKREHAIDETHRERINKVHQASGKGHDEAIEEHANGIERMCPQIVQSNGTVRRA